MNQNTLEVNIDFISKRIPAIVTNVQKTLESKKNVFLDLIKDTNTNYEKFLKFKHEVIDNVKHLMDGDNSNLALHKIPFCLDPLSILESVSVHEEASFMETYYQHEKALNQDDVLNPWDLFDKNNKDPFVSAYDKKLPSFTRINVTDMGFKLSQKQHSFPVPRIIVKSICNQNISNFTYSNKFNQMAQSCCITGTYQVNVDNALDRRHGVSELLVGQISIHDLTAKIFDCYEKAFYRTFVSALHEVSQGPKDELESNIINFIQTQQAAIGIPNPSYLDEEGEFDKITSKKLMDQKVKTIEKWIDDIKKKEFSIRGIFRLLDYLNPYAIFIFVSHLLSTPQEYEGSDDYHMTFVEKLQKEFDNAIESLITRTTISMVITYCAKCGLNDYLPPIDVNHDMIKDLMNITHEDVAAFNTSLTNTEHGSSWGVDKETVDGTLDNKTVSKLLRKRLFDYLMINHVSMKSSQSNYTQNRYFNNQDCFFLKDESQKIYQGSRFYNFMTSALQEVYSNKTLVANYQKTIVNFKNDNYVYKNTLELARPFIKKYINHIKSMNDLKSLLDSPLKELRPDTTVDELINYGCLNDPNTYSFNSIKNHRMFGALYKGLLHGMFKLYYITGTYQEMSKQEVMVKMPQYLRKKYLAVLEELDTILKSMTHFYNSASDNSVSWTNSQLSIKMFINGDIKSFQLAHEMGLGSSLAKASIAAKWIRFNGPYERNIQQNSGDNIFTSGIGKYASYCAIYFDESIEAQSVSQEYFMNPAVYYFIADFNNENSRAKDPELINTNPNLVISREVTNSLEEIAIENYTFHFDYDKVIKNFKNYILKTNPKDLSFEELATYSIFAESCERSLNKRNADIETIKDHEKKTKEFNELFARACDRYMLN